MIPQKLYTKFLNLLKLYQILFQQIRAKFTCMCLLSCEFDSTILLAALKSVYLYLKFEVEILKIVKVIAVFIVYLNSRASRVLMYACAFMLI